MAPAPLRLSGLRVRRQFLFAAQGRKASGRFVLLQGRATTEAGDGVLYGLTASKKVGNAVARNRARRRLRHALTALLPTAGQPGWCYVAVARTSTVEAPWAELTAELATLLRRLHETAARRAPDALESPRASVLPRQNTPGAARIPPSPATQTTEDP